MALVYSTKQRLLAKWLQFSDNQFHATAFGQLRSHTLSTGCLCQLSRSEQLLDFKHEVWASCCSAAAEEVWEVEEWNMEKKLRLTWRKRGFCELMEVIPIWNSMPRELLKRDACCPVPKPGALVLWDALALLKAVCSGAGSKQAHWRAASLRATPAPRRRWHCGVWGSKPGQAGPGPGAAPRGRAAGGVGLGAERARERPSGSIRPSGLSWTPCCVRLSLFRLSPRHGRGAALLPGLPEQLPRRLWLRRRAARPPGAGVPPAPRYRGRGAAAAWGGDGSGAGGLKRKFFVFF